MARAATRPGGPLGDELAGWLLAFGSAAPMMETAAGESDGRPQGGVPALRTMFEGAVDALPASGGCHRHRRRTLRWQPLVQAVIRTQGRLQTGDGVSPGSGADRDAGSRRPPTCAAWSQATSSSFGARARSWRPLSGWWRRSWPSLVVALPTWSRWPARCAWRPSSPSAPWLRWTGRTWCSWTAIVTRSWCFARGAQGRRG